MNREVPVVIPAYEPDDRLLRLLEGLVESRCFIIIVDDGSGSAYRKIFEEAARLIADNGVVLQHDKNMGKGRALKTAFSYIADQISEAVGAVTADSDGQHTVEAIQAVARAMREHDNALILGTRRFDKNVGGG